MNEAEFHKFDQLAREAGIPKEVYIRNLLNGLLLKPAPKEELVEVIRQETFSDRFSIREQTDYAVPVPYRPYRRT